MQPHLFVQICALNESATIGSVIAEIPRHIEGIGSVTVVVIDDGSSDDTAAQARAAGADIVVSHTGNQGLARAFQNGIDTCLDHGADIIVHTDADGQYVGADIPALVALVRMGKADVVIGDRGVASVQHFSPFKRFLQRLGSAMVQQASGVRAPDAVSGFRAYSREAALRLFVTTQFSYTVQTLIQAGKLGLVVRSVPIQARVTARPSRLHHGTLHFVSRQVMILLRTYVTYEPIKTFFGLAVPFLALGTGLLLRLVVRAAEQGGQLPGNVQSLVAGSISMIIGLLLLVTGVIADRVRENRRILEEILYRSRKQQFRQAVQRDVVVPGIRM
jgi:glycosyltransferase involved in cell wall biosynthesis